MADFRKSKLNHAYENSAAFRQCVNVIQKLISEHGLSPTEIREACFLATVKYEMEDPKAGDAAMNRALEFVAANTRPRP